MPAVEPRLRQTADADGGSGALGRRVAFILVALVSTLILSEVRAVDSAVLDSFSIDTEENPLGQDEGSLAADRDILGGFRDVLITGDVTGTGNEETFAYDGSGDALGSALLSWDGEDEDPFTLTFDGLGGVDLTIADIDAQDALVLRLASVATPGPIKLSVYTDDGNASVFDFTPVASGSPTEVLIPHAAFTIAAGGGADFSQVGAVTLELGGGLVAEVDEIRTGTTLAGATKADSLVVDANSNGLVEPGDTVRYSVVIPGTAAVAVSFADTPPAGTSLVVGSVTTSQGTVTSGNGSGDGSVTVDVGTLPAGGSVTVTFDVLVADPFSGPGTSFCNQGVVSGTGLVALLTDDPDVDSSPPDPTCTDVFVDVTAPTFTFVPADTAVPAGSSLEPAATGGFATATDDVTPSPSIAYADVEVLGPEPFQRSVVRTWTATDAAGNSADAEQRIEVTDSVSRALSVSRAVFGLFGPADAGGNRQLGSIELDGTIALLGNSGSIDAGTVTTSAGATAYDMVGDVVYFVGRTDADGVSRIFTVDTQSGVGVGQPLSAGSVSSLVGIWFDDAQGVLYGLFQVGAGLDERQLAEIEPGTGAVSFIGSSIPAPIFTIGGIVSGSGALGELYFLGSSGGLPGSLYTVDTTTGVATSAALSGANYNAIAGLEVDPVDGTVYALIFEGGERRLATVDPDTGTVTPLGATTVGGGGVSITTYSGVTTLDPVAGQFIFVGRYTGGEGTVWALFAVDTADGSTTFNTISTAEVTSNAYYGLEYALSIGRLELTKSLDPTDDPGVFDLQIDGATSGGAADVGNGGTTGELVVESGTRTVGEVAGTATSLDDYVAAVECRSDDGAGAVVASGSPPLAVDVSENADVVCVVTNTRKVEPTVTTTAVSAVTDTTASGGGEVTDDGGAAVTARGVVYGTSPNPTLADGVTVDGSGVGAFTSALTGLSDGTTYHVRAYATNAVGTAYGGEETFTTTTLATVTTTAVSAVTDTTASGGGEVTDDGGAAVTARGVVYGTSPNPTLADGVTVDGSGVGAFTSALTGLSDGTTYHVRAYATNAVGTAYGGEETFTTTTLATVTTTAVSAVTDTTASGGGEVTDDGGAAVTARGVVYGTSPNPTLADGVTVDGSGVGAFTSALTGLSDGTTYHVRAYATNAVGTAYGGEETFTTTTLATVTTTAVSAVTDTTASGGGEVTDDGGAAVTARGVVYGTSPNPTLADGVTVDGSGVGAFTSALTGLSDGTTYHVRAYATNAVGTAYGGEETFTTTTLATVTTTAVSAVTDTTASGGGEVTDDGGAAVTARGVVYGTSPNPTLADGVTVDGSGVGAFTSALTGLSDGTTYHVRAYATNAVGTAYGGEETFTTTTLATVTTTAVSAVTDTTASGGGEVTDDGGAAVTARGVVYGTSPNPTLADGVTVDGSGVGAFTSALTGLSDGTTYYVRAYATNAVGTAYGGEETFTTTTLATVTTTAVSAVTDTTASGGGEVTDDGGAAVTARGVVYGTSPNPTLADGVTVDGSGVGAFTSALAGLRAGIRYYVRAYATNAVGTAYGPHRSFATQPTCIPYVLKTRDGAVVTLCL